jgi:hypothetical protein
VTNESATVEIALVSHTNAGKTTLARTLLGADIGEVRDAPHVTEVAQAHTLLEAPDGEVLRLWDTPGFGDSARLVKRLRAADNPIGWLLREVWDRYRNRPLWCSQQAVRTVRDSADAVLYLVNAAESPVDAGYVAPEMQILTWIGKPVVVLLNQVGPPRPAADERSEIERWRSAMKAFSIVGDVLSLDAFARCWVQEGVLLRLLGRFLPAAKQPAMRRLVAVWQERNVARFRQSMGVLAQQLLAAVHDRQAVASEANAEPSRRLLSVLGLGGARESDPARSQAMAELAERADREIRSSTDRLIALHGLEGEAASIVLERLRTHYSVTEPMSEGRAAAAGGLASGALAGLMADFAAGGLTLGAGVIVGTLVGALGSRSVCLAALPGCSALRARARRLCRIGSPRILEGRSGARGRSAAASVRSVMGERPRLERYRAGASGSAGATDRCGDSAARPALSRLGTRFGTRAIRPRQAGEPARSTARAKCFWPTSAGNRTRLWIPVCTGMTPN